MPSFEHVAVRIHVRAHFYSPDKLRRLHTTLRRTPAHGPCNEDALPSDSVGCQQLKGDCQKPQRDIHLSARRPRGHTRLAGVPQIVQQVRGPGDRGA